MKPLLIVTVLAAAVLDGPLFAAASVAQADDASLRRRLAQFDREAATDNLDGLMGLFANDAVALGAGQAPLTGKAAIRTWWKGIIDEFDVQIVHDIGEIMTVGDVVILNGIGRGTLRAQGRRHRHTRRQLVSAHLPAAI